MNSQFPKVFITSNALVLPLPSPALFPPWKHHRCLYRHCGGELSDGWNGRHAILGGHFREIERKSPSPNFLRQVLRSQPCSIICSRPLNLIEVWNSSLPPVGQSGWLLCFFKPSRYVCFLFIPFDKWTRDLQALFVRCPLSLESSTNRASVSLIDCSEPIHPSPTFSPPLLNPPQPSACIESCGYDIFSGALSSSIPCRQPGNATRACKECPG